MPRDMVHADGFLLLKFHQIQLFQPLKQRFTSAKQGDAEAL